MSTEKYPDGFPVESGLELSIDYPCDFCGEHFDAVENGIAADATGVNGEYHKYAFCCYNCACDFAHDNGLLIDRYAGGPMDIKFRLDPHAQIDDPVAAAVKSIDVEGVLTDGATDEPTSEERGSNDDPDAQRPSEMHEKKVLQVWDRVVSNAQKIAQLASKIEGKNNELKTLKKDYESLVKRQNSYILQNGDGIQTTFADLDNAADPQPDAEAEDSLAWRDEPVTTLKNYGLTKRQADKAQEAFGTLGRLQDWLCADYRDKRPGIGQALQDKLTDALNKYTESFYKALEYRNKIAQLKKMED